MSQVASVRNTLMGGKKGKKNRPRSELGEVFFKSGVLGNAMQIGPLWAIKVRFHVNQVIAGVMSSVYDLRCVLEEVINVGARTREETAWISILHGPS